jgi:hypothetical protein
MHGGGDALGSNAGFHEKMDALDLVINALLDHEKRLDAISHRLETLASRTTRPKRAQRPPEEQRRAPPEPRVVDQPPHVLFHNWSEFATTCRGAAMAAFELTASHFAVYALRENHVFTYEEGLPDQRVKVSEDSSHLTIDKASVKTIDAFLFLLGRRLRCGLPLAIESAQTCLKDNEYLFELHYTLEPEAVKTFLSQALHVASDKIVEGQITF